jgi:hypothetical protein
MREFQEPTRVKGQQMAVRVEHVTLVRRPSTGSSRDGQLHQLAGVRKRRVGGFEAGHHSGQFGGSISLRNWYDAAGRDLSVAGLDHHVVPIRESGNLRQVGDHDDLSVARQARQPSTDLHRHPAADPGVNLVEDQRSGFLGGSEDYLQSQSHP